MMGVQRDREEARDAQQLSWGRLHSIMQSERLAKRFISSEDHDRNSKDHCRSEHERSSKDHVRSEHDRPSKDHDRFSKDHVRTEHVRTYKDHCRSKDSNHRSEDRSSRGPENHGSSLEELCRSESVESVNEWAVTSPIKPTGEACDGVSSRSVERIRVCVSFLNVKV